MNIRIMLWEVICVVFLIWPANSQYDNTEFDWMLQSVSNYTDLCNFMGKDDCSKLIHEVEFEEQSGDMVAVSGGPQIALFDACNPRMQTIAIPRHPNPEIMIWPPCTRARRCGGCCTSDVFSCEPTETVDKYVKVFDTKLAYPGAQRFTFVGIRNVRIVEHTQCDAQCKTKAHECHKYQEYKHRKCRCECKPERLQLRSTCHKNQRWDDSECDCICPNRATTKCPPPFRFSTTTCKCTIKTEVTGEIDLDVLIERMEQLDRNFFDPNRKIENSFDFGDLFKLPGQIDRGQGEGEFMGSVNRPDMPNQELPEVTTTTSTSTTTTTEPTTTTSTTTEPTTTTTEKIVTTEKPKPNCTVEYELAGKKCFGNWKPVRLHNGKCSCRPVIAIGHKPSPFGRKPSPFGRKPSPFGRRSSPFGKNRPPLG